jgi:hypothetical protein
MTDRIDDLLAKAVAVLTPDERNELLVGLMGTRLGQVGAGGSWSVSLGPPLAPGPELRFEPMEPRPDVRAVAAAEGPALAAGPDPELKVLPVRLPVADYERLRAFSREHGFSMAVIIRTLVERFLDQRGVPAPEDPAAPAGPQPPDDPTP